MDSLKLFILALTQGITELLPVSSSGHILILGNLMDISVSTAFLTFLHIGTTLAIVIFFRKIIFQEFFSKNNRVFLLKIILGSIPAVVIGLLFEDYISEVLRAPWVMSLSLIFWGVVMILVERYVNNKDSEIKNISLKQSLIVGVAQSVALIPGTSRSGITTIAGILSGLDKYTALRFGFLIGIPILLGSSVWGILKEVINGNTVSSILDITSISEVLILLLVPFFVGYFALSLVERFKKSNWLTLFGIYRIFVGVIVVLLEYWP